MSQAPTLEDLFDHEGQLEQAFAAHLASDQWHVFTSRSTDDIPANRALLVEALLGPATGHQIPKDKSGTGQQEQDRFSATIRLSIQTMREENEDTPSTAAIRALHGRLTALVRARMLRGVIASSQTFHAPWLTLIQIDFAGQEKLMDDETGVDVSILSYQIEFAIASASWPQEPTTLTSL